MRFMVAPLLAMVVGGPLAAAADSKSTWTIAEQPDGYVREIRVAADGDLVVAGNFRGTFALGAATPIESKYQSAFVGRVSPTGTVRWLRAVERGSKYGTYWLSGLTLDAGGGILLDVHLADESKLFRVSISADGATQTRKVLLEAKGFLKTSAIGTDTLVMGGQLEQTKCKGAGLPVYRLSTKATIMWSACNATKQEIEQEPHVASLADGRSAICAGRAVMALTAKGKRTLNAVYEQGDDPDVRCEGVSIGADGQIAALRSGIEASTVLETWSAKGKAGWKKACTDIMKSEGFCRLTTVTAEGGKLLVGVQYGEKSAIVRLDAKSGAIEASFPYGRAAYTTIAAKDGAVYFSASGIGLARAK